MADDHFGGGGGGGGKAGAPMPSPSLGEAPLPPHIIRGLGDRSYDKRKNAALDLEQHIKLLAEADDRPRIEATLHLLGQEFCTSTNSNHRKGGLIALAAAAIGLMSSIRLYLDLLLPPILHCFDDPESRVRYYACESLYNVAKVARQDVLLHFNTVFEGLCKLFADGDPDVKNGANLLDRLIKDIVTESDIFDVEKFIPILKKFIRRTNPYIRQLLVGWITVLDEVPEINMLDWLPEFLDGLFFMLSDENKELRQAAGQCLDEFLREIRANVETAEVAAMVPILITQAAAKDRSIRLTAVQWVHEFVRLAWARLLPLSADLLGALMHCISDGEPDIRKVAESANHDLLLLVKETAQPLDYGPLLRTLTTELLSHHVPTRLACLHWLAMLVEKAPTELSPLIEPVLLPALLRALADQSDDAVLLDLQVLARISVLGDAEFRRVLHAVLHLFQTDRKLLEHRGSLVIRQLCVLLEPQAIYLSLARVLSDKGEEGEAEAEEGGLEFVAMMVQTLNLILLTASELAELRALLRDAFGPSAPKAARETFVALFCSWCHNPVATFSLCLLAQAYPVSAALVEEFARVEITVGFLMQVDKLVQLLESPAFVLLRLQLLDAAQPLQPALLKSLYGILMILPQSTAYRTLNDRLATVATHNQTLLSGAAAGGRVLAPSTGSKPSITSKEQEKEIGALMETFQMVQARHAKARAEGLRRRSLLSSSSSSAAAAAAAGAAGAAGAGGRGEGFN